MSTIRTIPPETGTSGPVVSPDTIRPLTPTKVPVQSSSKDLTHSAPKAPNHSPSEDLARPSTFPEDPNIAVSTPARSTTSTPTTTATLTPNGRHRAIPLVPVSQQRLSTHNPSHGYPRRSRGLRHPHPQYHGNGQDEEVVAAPHEWMEVKRSWWKRVWSWLRGWGFR